MLVKLKSVATTMRSDAGATPAKSKPGAPRREPEPSPAAMPATCVPWPSPSRDWQAPAVSYSRVHSTP
jgi:hypothetical protein